MKILGFAARRTSPRRADRPAIGRALALVAVLAAAGTSGCRSGGARTADSGPVQAPGAGQAGAVSSAAAVERFLGAARANDYRTMGAVFGTREGAIAARDGANDVEKRMRTLACYLGHDRVQVLDDLPAGGAERIVMVELTQRELVRRSRFTAVPGPRGRWYVRQFEIEPLADFCRPG